MKRYLLALLTIFWLPTASFADEDVVDLIDNATCMPTEECVDIGYWEFGVAFGWGQKSNPVRGNQDIPLYLIPSITYYGESWYFDNGNLGYTLAEEERYTLNLTTSYGADPFYFIKTSAASLFYSGIFFKDKHDKMHFIEFFDEFNELENRDFTLFGGLELYIYTPVGIVKLAAGKDLFGVHNGTQAEALWSYNLAYDRWNFDITLALDWKSSQVINYYYGVRQSENLFWSFIYRPHAGFNQRIEGRINYAVNENWNFLIVAQHTQLSEEIARSPLVFENYSNTLFIGATYKF